MKSRAALSALALALLGAVACAPPSVDGTELDGEHDGVDDLDEEGEVEDKVSLDPAVRRAFVSTNTACPTSGRISQGFSGKHDGVDLANAKGTPIFAVGAGTVTVSGTAQGYGQWIRIKHDDGSMTEYGHMYERLVDAGVRVKAGQKIALMGSEGRSTGPHLHLRTYRSANSVGARKRMNPASYMSARGIRLPCTPGTVSAATDAGITASSATPGTTAVSVWQDAVLRSAPQLDASQVGSVADDTTYAATCWKTGDEVQSDGYANDRWVKLTSGGTVGFVSAIFLRGNETGGVEKQCP